MAKAVGVEPDIVHVPMDIARRARPPLLHWGEALVGSAMFSIDAALRDLDWAPSFGLEDGYRDSYEWFDREGRDRYECDFSGDDAVLAELELTSRPTTSPDRGSRSGRRPAVPTRRRA